MPLQEMVMAASAASFSAGSTAAVRDDAERLGALFDRHHQRLYRLARRLCREADDARDAVQETFLRAARAPASVPDGMPHEEAWLVRVLINICRDRWRLRASRTRLDPRGDAARPLQSADPEVGADRAVAGLARARRAAAAAPRDARDVRARGRDDSIDCASCSACRP